MVTYSEGNETASLFTGKQTKVMREVGNLILKYISGGATPSTELFSKEEQDAYKELEKEFKSATDPEGSFAKSQQSLESFLSGKPAFETDLATSEKLFQEAIGNPARREYNRSVLPSIKRAFGSFSTASGNAATRAATDMEATLAASLAQFQTNEIAAGRYAKESALNRQMDAANMLPQMLANRLGYSGSYLGLLGDKQSRVLGEEARLRPENNPWLSIGMQFSGLNGVQNLGSTTNTTGFSQALAGISSVQSILNGTKWTKSSGVTVNDAQVGNSFASYGGGGSSGSAASSSSSSGWPTLYGQK